VGAFALTTFATVLTRGSVLLSVHAVARSAVGPMYLGFLVLVLAGGFGGIAAQAWRLRSEGRFDSALSREAAFLGNNLALLAITFVVLLGTIFPLLIEATTNRQITVGGPYFKESTVPLFLLLLFLIGVGPILSWRRSSSHQVVRRVIVPVSVGSAVMVALAASGMRNLAALAAYGLASFVLAANIQEIVRGVRSFERATQMPIGAAVPAAVARNRRLYGGLVAHVGVAIAAIAITTSTAFAHQAEVTLPRGGQVSFAGYVLRYEGLRVVRQPQRVVDVAEVTVARNGRSLGEVIPSLNTYPSAPNDPIGTPSIKYGVFKDLYSSLLGFTASGDQATFRFFLNPGVLWLWIGGAIVALGGLLAAWPGRRRRVAEPAVAHVPELVGMG